MSICVICGDYLLQSKQINMFLRSLRLQNIIILLKIMKERQIVMDLCTIFAHKVKIGCTLDEKQMEMQTLNKKADGTYEYETPVKYWMPFNGGVGFHDASWQPTFGGSRYQTNGSHGCVNMPPEMAGKLFELISAGTPVLVHN